MGIQRVFLVDGIGAGRRLNLTARLRAKFAAHESGSGTKRTWAVVLRHVRFWGRSRHQSSSL